MTLSVKSQEIVVPTSPYHSVQVNIHYVDPFADLMQDFYKYGIPYSTLNGLNAIYIATPEEIGNALGMALYGTIKMNPHLPPYTPTLREAILYHEVGHIIGLEHGCGPYLMRKGQDINEEYIIQAWPQIKHEYLTFLKQWVSKQ